MVTLYILIIPLLYTLYIISLIKNFKDFDGTPSTYQPITCSCIIDEQALLTYDFIIYIRHKDLIMQTKLTLRLEDSLIQQAKSYAKQHDKSLSQVVSDYFQILILKGEIAEAPPITRSLIGILESEDSEPDDYKKHLEKKYL